MSEHKIREKLGDGPIEYKFHKDMNMLAHTLDRIFNGGAEGDDKKVGFCLMVFNFGGDGRANYISNAKREDVVVLLKEQVKRFEGQVEQEGHA